MRGESGDPSLPPPLPSPTQQQMATGLSFPNNCFLESVQQKCPFFSDCIVIALYCGPPAALLEPTQEVRAGVTLVPGMFLICKYGLNICHQYAKDIRFTEHKTQDGGGHTYMLPISFNIYKHFISEQKAQNNIGGNTPFLSLLYSLALTRNLTWFHCAVIWSTIAKDGL